MWTSTANSILLERPLKRTHSVLLIFLLITGVRLAGAALLDSVVRLPPLPSLDEARAMERRFNDSLVPFCDRPGSIRHFSSDSTCFNPAWQYGIGKKQDSDDSLDADDSLVSASTADSTALRNYLVAMYTYDKFSAPMNKLSKACSFSHAIFLGYLEEEAPVAQKSWLLKAIEKILDAIDRYFFQPLLRYLIGPVARFSLFWKIVVFAVSVSLFIFVMVTVARFAAKFYPVPAVGASGRKRENGAVYPAPVDWLQKARVLCGQGSLVAASECVYRHLLSWTSDRSRIKRYEWWTNRQLLRVVKKRFAGDYATARDIVDAYEYAVFGHTPVDAGRLGELIERADLLEGRKSS